MIKLKTLPESFVRINDIILLGLVIFIVFVAPVFIQSTESVVYSGTMTLIFFSAVLALERARRKLLVAAIIAISTEWLAGILQMKYLIDISNAFNFLFFGFVVFAMIFQVARSKAVTVKEIIESIIGYLLLGLVYSIVLVVINRNAPGSIAFPVEPNTYGDFIYYGFVTLTTLGYGDINPVSPLARSAAIFISVTGQLYVATIIAIIVSKYSGDPDKKK